MQVRIGLSGNDLKTRTHSTASFSSTGLLRIGSVDGAPLNAVEATLTPGRTLVVGASGSRLSITGLSSPLHGPRQRMRIAPANANAPICISSLSRGGRPPCYRGTFEVSALDGKLRIVLVCQPDSYLSGVLESEMPAHYHLEAIKAQAVTARTYGLNPRIDHSGEGFNVCDSYLCCQNFTGNARMINSRYAQAITDTHNEILTGDGRPILALFSSISGGHTENYEDCFSDPVTGQFPPAPLPYLKGVAEGKLPAHFPAEEAMRVLWNLPRPDTCDSWSPHFRWKVEFPADALESHMHHIVESMRENAEYAPFIKPPESSQFGHIDRFEIGSRGVAGTAIAMTVHTSTGLWVILKELVIRSAFENPDLKLKRLKSARIFFDHERDSLGLLSRLVVHGFGWGHGVGLQQTGAQGLALTGKSYREILGHYFTGVKIEQLKD